MGNPNFAKFLKDNLEFRHEVGLKIKNAPGQRSSDGPQEHNTNLQKKQGGGVESTPRN